MIRIAVCEDLAEDRAEVVALLRLYLRRTSTVGAKITAFEDGVALLETVTAGEAFDLYFLDILMPELDGMEVGRRLRALGSRSLIIYLTTSRDFAVDSYEVRAFHYLLKPLQQEKLFHVLDAAFEMLRRREQEAFIVQTPQGRQRVAYDRILYVEYCRRRMQFVCNEETISSTMLHMPFRDAVAELNKDGRFYVCGASLLLNLSRVSSVNGQTVVLDNGMTVIVPRLAAPALKNAWGRFWLEEEDG